MNVDLSGKKVPEELKLPEGLEILSPPSRAKCKYCGADIYFAKVIFEGSERFKAFELDGSLHFCSEFGKDSWEEQESSRKNYGYGDF